MLGPMEGDLASPLLSSNAPIDLGSLHPELLKEVQHVVIAREDLLLHVNEIIGRGEGTQKSPAWNYKVLSAFLRFLHSLRLCR